jgi:hypothetical protein
MKNSSQTGIKINLSKRLKLQWSLSAAALCIALVNGFSGARASQNTSDSLGNDDTEFVFAGKCPNGEKYRLFSYEKYINGQAESFYDYEGPAGQGTIRSSTTPRTLSVRVCRKQAEIIDDQ